VRHLVVLALTLLSPGMVRSAWADDGGRLLSIDHFVGVQTTISGQTTQIYVREVALSATVTRGPARADRAVLFVHGACVPGEVAFDVPFQDYSWMAYLARVGFDVFAMDFTGYGNSTRPNAMNDPCNLSPKQQAGFAPGIIPSVCSPSYPRAMTTIASDWNDLAMVVEHVLALRHIDQISIIGWSMGGPRVGGYAAQHPEKVRKLVLLASAYNRGTEELPPVPLPAEGPAMNIQSYDEFVADSDRQAGCPGQLDPAVRDAVWSAMLESDPVGATWGTGVRRAPHVFPSTN
jgi:pimeloyl-ACP methyl ester carboxylesterase